MGISGSFSGLRSAALLASLTLADWSLSAHLRAERLRRLYDLNRHERLRALVRRTTAGPERIIGRPFVLGAALRAAWHLRDEAALDALLRRASKAEITIGVLDFIAPRRSVSAAFGAAAAALEARALTDASVDPSPARLRALEVLQAFDPPETLRAALEASPPGAARDRYLGCVAMREERWRDAWELLETAVAADPGDAATYAHLGDVALHLDAPAGRIDTLIARRAANGAKISGYDRLKAHRHLLAGDLLAFLLLRDVHPSAAAAKRLYGARARMGADAVPVDGAADRAAFVIGRDGVADEIRWSAHYPALAAAYRSVEVSCDPRLKSLFERSYPGIVFHPVARDWGRSLKPLDWAARGRIPHRELAIRLNDRAYAASLRADDAMFAEDVAVRSWRAAGVTGPPAEGYPPGATLRPDPARAAQWRRRLASPRLKIGLIWRSALIDPDRRRHYMSLDAFSGLAAAPVDLISIQHSATDEERAAGRRMGVRFFDDEIDLYDDFEEIAAFVSALDLVVGVSTLPYEMAAAVGTECWLCAISPLGRWMRLGAEGTRGDRLTRNGQVFFPRGEDGYLGDWERRSTDIMAQIEAALAGRAAGEGAA